MTEKTRLLIDGHVHVYDCFDLEFLFDKAVTQLDYFYNAHYANGSPECKLLLLTEAKENDFFAKWSETGLLKEGSAYGFRHTEEEESLLLEKDGKPSCVVVRGRQIVTKESLEVLAIGAKRDIPDGQPIETVLNGLFEKEIPAVLAWGFGKWLFKRGKVIDGLIDSIRHPLLLVGDNSGRPVFWGTPASFKKATAMNIPLISGSDPLPFAGEEAKAGSFGFSLEGEFDRAKPFQSLRTLLSTLDVGAKIQRFGYRDRTISFFKRQSKIYLKKYIR